VGSRRARARAARRRRVGRASLKGSETIDTAVCLRFGSSQPANPAVAEPPGFGHPRRTWAHRRTSRSSSSGPGRPG
jgi:hypothetical protein